MPALDAGRAAVAALTGMTGADVVYTTGANHSLDLLLRSWTGDRTVACLPGEYGPNLAVMAANGFQVSALPADGDGRLAIDEAATVLAVNPPGLVHLTPLASHRGIVQPARELADVCRGLGVPLVIDAAQALGHIDCAVGADAVYSSSRKWIAGPRGVGVLAIQPALAQRLRPPLPPPDWDLPMTVMEKLAHGEANVGAHVGLSVALGEHLAAGPEMIRARLADVGQADPQRAGRRRRMAGCRARRRADVDHDLGGDKRRGPAAGAGLAHRRTGHRHHVRRVAARTVRADRACATGIAACRHHRRRPGHIRRSPGRRHRRGVTEATSGYSFCTNEGADHDRAG